MNEIIRIGSRSSQLALWQANHIADTLRAAGHSVDIEIIRTTGDRMQQPDTEAIGALPALAPLTDGKGIFIKEIEEALAEGRIDLAVHSLKDLPTELDARFMLAAIPPRADARDVWVCEQYWALHTLPMGGRIGTTSPRRQAQLLALRPDVSFVEIRGNVDTRLRKLASGECDALVLAGAGLDRLNRAEWVHQRFAIDELCPAPGQGALALETRASRYAASLRPATTITCAAPSPLSTTPKRASPSKRSAPCSTSSAAAVRFPSAFTARLSAKTTPPSRGTSTRRCLRPMANASSARRRKFLMASTQVLSASRSQTISSRAAQWSC